MTGRVRYWFLTHPRVARPLQVVGFVQALALLAVCAAPEASASSNAVVLNWTGLKDSYGLAIGDYYLSLASAAEQITETGPGVTWDPTSWVLWTLHSLAVMGTHWSVATILTGEAGLFVGIIAIALVILRITVSTYWLSVIGEIARALTGAVVQVTAQLGLVLICIPIGVFAGVVTIKRGEAGRGWTMILVAVTMPALSVAVFSDPAGEMYGPNGLLAFGRRIGFSVAEAATHNGQLATGAGAGGQVDSLTASLITHTVREPLQLWNFGHIVDRVGGCGAAWSAAIRVGAPDGPLHAMGFCGDKAALAYGQHLDGTNAWVGLVFVVAATALGIFVVVSGWAVLRVSVKAVWTTVILLPALWVGSIPGAPQHRAMEVVWQFFRHGVEVLVYIVYVSVVGLAIERLVSAPLPAQLGGTNPFAHVLMMGAASVAALVLLRHVKAEMAGRPDRRRMLGRASEVAVGMGVSAAVGGAASAGLAGLQRLRGGVRSQRERTPWDELDQDDNAALVHGPPQPGFDPILTTTGGNGEPTGGPGQPEGYADPAARPEAMPLILGQLLNRDGAPASGRLQSRDGGAAAATSQQVTGDIAGRGQFGPSDEAPSVASAGDEPRVVPSVAEPFSGAADEESVARSPLPGAEPPPDNGPAPPPPTTVDPITE
jgi:hypothetical protein